MNTAELTALLGRIQVLDNRQVDEMTLQAWEPLIGDLDYEDAVAGVNAHFRHSTDYLKPAHVRSRAKRAKTEREERQRGIAVRRLRALGGEAPRYAMNAWQRNQALTKAGALIEAGDPQGDAAIQKIIAVWREEENSIEAGRDWVAKNGLKA